MLEFKKILSYLSKRNQSYYQFLLKRPIKTNLLHIEIILLSLLSFTVILFINFNLKKLFIKDELLWLIWILIVTHFIFSGGDKSLNRMKPHNINHTDYKFLLSLNLKHCTILIMKLYETIIVKHIFTLFFFFTSSTIILNYLFFHNILIALIISMLFTIVFSIYKLFLFLTGIRLGKVYNILYSFYIMFIWINIIYAINFVITDYIKINKTSILSDIFYWTDKFINITIIPTYFFIKRSSFLGGIITVLPCYFAYLLIMNIKKIDLNDFDLLKVNNQSDTSETAFQKQNKVLDNLLILYFKRLVKCESLKLFLPIILAILSVVNIYFFVSLFLKESGKTYLLRTDMSFLISMLFLSKVICDTFGFISSIDFHKENFKIFKLSNISIKKILTIHIKALLVVETFIILLIVIPVYFYFKLTFIHYLLYVGLIITLVFTFNLYNMLASCSFPNFKIEDITKLPSTRGRIASNFLMTFHVVILLVLITTIKMKTIAIVVLILLNIILSISVVYLVSKKIAQIYFDEKGH